MIYFNNAATTFPKPQCTIDAVTNCVATAPVHSGRSGMEEECEDMILATREKIAKLFNAPNPLRIVFTSGSTEALNLAIRGAGLEGGHVVSTCIEHNSVIRPLKTMEKEGVIEVDFVDCDETGYVTPEAIDAAIKSNTKAVVVNHSSNVTGATLDLKAISKYAHAKNCLFIVDASQSAGAVPIDVLDMDVDYLAFTGHKSLYGVSGIGGLYIKEGLVPKPLKTGGTGVKSEVLTQPLEMPLYYEAGTPNLPGIASLHAGLTFIEETGFNVIHEKKKKLMTKIMDELDALPEITSYYNKEHNSYAVYPFNLGKFVPEEVNYILESTYDIHVRSGLHCAPLLLKHLGVNPWGTVRASPSYFSTEEEVDKFIFGIKDTIDTFMKK